MAEAPPGPAAHWQPSTASEPPPATRRHSAGPVPWASGAAAAAAAAGRRARAGHPTSYRRLLKSAREESEPDTLPESVGLLAMSGTVRLALAVWHLG